MGSEISALKKLYRFYYEGFTGMSWWGKRVWIIIIIKLFIIFLILKLLFFKDFLGSRYDNEKQKSEYVLDRLISE
jgi:hypothetical protein